jgi:thiamine pyrophosphate-dependent acetolactate synthase large subunit-like protein
MTILFCCGQRDVLGRTGTKIGCCFQASSETIAINEVRSLGIVDETHPYSQPGVQEEVEKADCVLLFGVRFIDTTTIRFKWIKRTHRIDIRDWSGKI